MNYLLTFKKIKRKLNLNLFKILLYLIKKIYHIKGLGFTGRRLEFF